MKQKASHPKNLEKSDSTSPIKTFNKNCTCKQNKIPNIKKTTYNLWRLGQCKDKSKLAKDPEKDITLLVRCNQDGYMIDHTGTKQFVAIEPKLEYQYEFGAEITSSIEAAKQWATLTFRPGTDLLRTRILPCSGEIVMIEKIPLHNIKSELCKKQVCKPENILGCYFNVFSRISKLQPGQYILSHEAKHRAFVALYSSTNESVNGGLNLEEYYKNMDKSSLNQTAPWSSIDPSVVTPNHEHHKIMPCMFNYGNCKLLRVFENKTKTNRAQTKNWNKAKKYKKKKA